MENEENIELKSTKKITKGAILGYLSLILSIISGLFFTPWIIQSISKESYGLYNMSFSIVNLFLFDFGLSATVNVYLSRLKAENEDKKISNFIGMAYKLYFCIDFIIGIVFLILFFVSDFIYTQLLSDELRSFKISFIMVGIFSLISFPCNTINGIFFAYEKFSAIKIIDIIQKVLYIIFTSITIIFNWGLFALVGANCLSGLFAVIIKIVIYKKMGIKAEMHNSFDVPLFKNILAFSIWAAINSLTGRLVFNIMPSLFGIIPTISSDSATTSSAIFGIGASLESYVYMFGSVLGGFFLPKIQRLKVNPDKNQEDIDRLAYKLGKIQFVLIGLVFVGFVCCGKEFIMLWMKGDVSFTPAYYGTLMMISYHLIYIPQIVFYTQMTSENDYIKKLCIATIAKAVLNLGLSILLIYLLGSIGAFASVFIARIFELILENILYYKILGANLKLFFLKVYGRMSCPFIISMVLGLILHFFLPLENIYKFVIIGCTVVIIYINLTYFIGLNSNEKKLLKSKFKIKYN